VLALTIYRVKALEARPGGDLFLAFGAGFDRWPGLRVAYGFSQNLAKFSLCLRQLSREIRFLK
jgi:hypothetical protein